MDNSQYSESIFCEACGILVSANNLCKHFCIQNDEESFEESNSEVQCEDNSGVCQKDYQMTFEELLISNIEARPILEAIRSIQPPPPLLPIETPQINPICIRLSEMLQKLPPEDRIDLEIKLLQVAKDFIYKK
ncbi:hypothetical protein NQ314_008216 [Rhamnusium bicolor]|uniref:Uncharacterized protein n=1 Tax=Rhamnusium bicolor TaxID=1586634 RepID=A0AAV8YG89_9CUCU|nr:hypothetical protein NQ314_008216 [Rhamnusium bicolor]